MLPALALQLHPTPAAPRFTDLEETTVDHHPADPGFEQCIAAKMIQSAEQFGDCCVIVLLAEGDEFYFRHMLRDFLNAICPPNLS
jgi:hypothetical protein